MGTWYHHVEIKNPPKVHWESAMGTQLMRLEINQQRLKRLEKQKNQEKTK